MSGQIKNEIEKAKTIHITSHLGPDLDAYTSALFVYNVLTTNFPEKVITISITEEETPTQVIHLPNADKIEKDSLIEAVSKHKPELIILTDGGDLKMFTTAVEDFQEDVKSIGAKTINFDHHDSHRNELFDFNIVERRLSCVEVVFEYLVTQFGYKTFESWEKVVMLGLISDSDRFYFESDFAKESLELAARITASGPSIREIDDLVNALDKPQMKYLSALFGNIKFADKYVYTDCDYDFIIKLKESGLTSFNQRIITRKFVDSFLNHVTGYDLCFYIKRSSTSPNPRLYTISFRSKEGTINCAEIGKIFNGGGYVSGAGGVVEADTLDEAKKLTCEKLDKYLAIKI